VAVIVALSAVRDGVLMRAVVGMRMLELAVTVALATERDVRVRRHDTNLSLASRTVAVRNTGSVPHEFVVLRTDKPAADLMKGARADEAGNVGETGDLAVGAAKTLHLNLKPGHYALICNLPGHYQAGQHVDFTVK
jgi:uncharacterized cupredoxin-like copper-binding protein